MTYLTTEKQKHHMHGKLVYYSIIEWYKVSFLFKLKGRWLMFFFTLRVFDIWTTLSIFLLCRDLNTHIRDKLRVKKNNYNEHHEIYFYKIRTWICLICTSWFFLNGYIKLFVSGLHLFVFINPSKCSRGNKHKKYTTVK